MPAKKRKAKRKVKKKVKRKVKRKPARRKKPAKKKRPAKVQKKIDFALKRFIFFAILFVVSLVLYSVSGAVLWTTIFGVLAIIFGFIGIALLITLLTLLFMKK